MQRRAAAGVARIGVRATGNHLVDFGPVLGHGRGDMEELRPVAQPEPPVYAVRVDDRPAPASCAEAGRETPLMIEITPSILESGAALQDPAPE